MALTINKGNKIRVGDLKPGDTFRNKNNHYVVTKQIKETVGNVTHLFCFEHNKHTVMKKDSTGYLVNIEMRVTDA